MMMDDVGADEGILLDCGNAVRGRRRSYGAEWRAEAAMQCGGAKQASKQACMLARTRFTLLHKYYSTKSR